MAPNINLTPLISVDPNASQEEKEKAYEQWKMKFAKDNPYYFNTDGTRKERSLLFMLKSSLYNLVHKFIWLL